MNESDIVSWGKNCLKLEAETLERSIQFIDETNFSKAVLSIISSNGRVVVTGLGKSGHVGRKISSSLASTGTPSFYLHPSEALHGDLGRLRKNDVLLAIAFGGETSEVLSVASYGKRLGMIVIAITGKLSSTLAELSDFVLNGSIEQEACPNNLAPTTSSTLALALGDALTVALMKARGFEKEDFAQFHPGGSLGKSLARVEEFMAPLDELSFVGKGSSFSEIVNALSNNNFGIVAVNDSTNSFCGCISDGDIRRAVIEHANHCFHLHAEEFLSKNKPITIRSKAFASEAIKLMEENKITKIFVVDKSSVKQVVGLVDMNALLAAKIV